MQLLVAVFTEGNLVGWSISSSFTSLKMMNVKFDIFLLGRMSTAALAGIAVSPEHILPYIVVSVHFSLLVVLSLRDRLTFFNGFQQLQIKLSGLYDHFADGKNVTDSLNAGNMFLDFDLYRWR